MHSPSTDTLHYVKSLLQRKAKEVLLCITNSTLMVKDCFTKVSRGLVAISIVCMFMSMPLETPAKL